MSIKVQHLTKQYGNQKALDSISFEIPKGQIVGFLGPNGAGKSTTMKILTCYIAQTQGTASVCGFDIQTQSIDVRKHIGYLPESNPLYFDMYVKEYLDYVCNVFRLDNKTQRIKNTIEQTGLGIEQNKKIGQLSKGYKQRVGLAQAIIHDPQVLILDEPTSGLDPNQLVDIRNLIVELGKQKTVILSTHIMQEVQSMCERIIIIDQGKIVADDTAQNLKKQTEGEKSILVEFAMPLTKQQTEGLNKIKTATRINMTNPNQALIYAKNNNELAKAIVEWAVQHNIDIVSLNKQENSLENIFRELTKK